MYNALGSISALYKTLRSTEFRASVVYSEVQDSQSDIVRPYHPTLLKKKNKKSGCSLRLHWATRTLLRTKSKGEDDVLDNRLTT